MRFPRSAGVLLHPTSLPSPYGIGDFGPDAYTFINFLELAKQSMWQVLPLGVTGYGDSPYQSFSAFAGNPMLISPALLVRDGFLPAEALAEVPDFPEKKVDFGPVITYKEGLFKQAFSYFKEKGSEEQKEAFAAFCEENGSWLDDFAAYMAIKQLYVDHEGGVWNTWPKPLAQRDEEALAEKKEELADDIQYYQFLQYLFFDQWLSLKRYANEKGIKVVGDIPIFVAFDSADVWSNPELFYLDEDGGPTVIAGVPPDYFSETGQRWGNPLYRWPRMAKNSYQWWVERLKMTFLQADIVRIDHFRGFEAYWEIPSSEPTAIKGRWVAGPGSDLFIKLREALGELPIIAEDLGLITPGVEALRDEFDFPGMKILQFAFGAENNNSFLPHMYGRNCVVYTGTHDNNTTLGWYEAASERERDHVRRYLARDGHDIVWDMIRAIWASSADTAVVPMQDLFKLGEEARMNYPGKASGFWQWRYTADMLRIDIAHRLADLTVLYGREPEDQKPPLPEADVLDIFEAEE
ncbi:MAG TPA: 4-alpha-glucanotransferase [Anaerolineae bacterium]|nr:4-alpha-glucanotransferase [Anaerolineae bacterium]